ncbi:MAG: NADH-quinone oxidoreductase subunit NuoE family protein, partial [Planctomycetota bacterium]
MLETGEGRTGAEIETLVEEKGETRDALIPILQALQKRHGLISDMTMQIVADRLHIPAAEVESVVSFYHFLAEERHGTFVIRLCRTLSCQMLGKDAVARQLTNDLGIDFGETTPDGRFTLGFANCLGMCDQGPALLINDRIFTRVTPETVHDILMACSHPVPGHDPIEAEPVSSVNHRITFETIPPGEGLHAASNLTPEGLL